MVRFSRRPPPGRLFLHRADGRTLRRELPARALESFSLKVVALGGTAAARSWERAQQLGSAEVLKAWPQGLPRPERAMLGKGDARQRGIWLEAAFAPGANLQEIAEDLEQALLEREPLEPMLAEAEPAERMPPSERMQVRRTPVAPIAPTAPPETSQETVLVRRSAAVDLAPADQLLNFSGIDPSLLDTSVDVRPADLPGLNPGDRLHSPRRGRCTVLRPFAAPGLTFLRDARGQEFPVAHAELTAEFSFDDAEE
jgi:hypothetical protein